MVKRLALSLIVAGAGLLGIASHQLYETERHQARELRELAQAFHSTPPVDSGTSRISAARRRASAGEAWGRLEIERVGLSVALDEGVDGPTLRHAVGHLPGSAFPGEPGNVVLAGHRDSLFRPLRHVRSGDRLRLTTLDGVFEYDVAGTEVVPPERTEIAAATERPELTLITCYPFDYVGPAPMRFIVKARPLSETALPAGRSARAR